MPSERENMPKNSENGILTPRDYNIAGNVLRAYYDADNKLVFVLDLTLNDAKQNVLLVINPVGDRKWDDVLANDYAVDLESVRPKKDNKYQKLDIEYSGLAEYDDLIRAYVSGDDLNAAVRALDDFRAASVYRSATERLAAANATADKARDTISKTNETIADLQVRVKQLRSKLAQQRREIGREPTKQSAAKILRSEAQIDATNEKLGRAKKRLTSAQRRLVAAEEDAETARAIIDRGVAPLRTMAVGAPAPVAVAPQFEEIVTTPETNTKPKAEEKMAEEVKPLFDKDPEILDEEIAFKPIDFSTPQAGIPRENTSTSGADTFAPIFEDVNIETDAPLSFVPPTQREEIVEEVRAPIDVRPIAPVLDSITTVQEADAPVQLDPQFTNAADVAPVVREDVIASVTPQPASPVATPAPMPEISPAPVSSDFRPVSPISGAAPVRAGGHETRRPTLLYYVMLVLLIALSIFTLWIYQKSTGDNVPDLTTATQPEVVAPAPQESAVQEESPFIEPAKEEPQPVAETVVVAPMPEPVVEPEPVIVPEPVPVTVAEPEPAIAEPEPVPVMAEPVEVTPEPVVTDGPFLSPEPEPQPVTEPVVNKPAYNVSQQENMFVAAPDYETDAQYSDDEYYAEPDVYSAPAPVGNDMPTCGDGSLPDVYGCCAGEVYSAMDDGTYACCADAGLGECFQPLF